MNILISGGSGFLGSALSEWITQHAQHPVNITWLSRDTTQAHPSYVSMMSYDDLQVTQQNFEVIVNLAGAGIADKRWTEQRKQQLFDSRLMPTQSILDYIARITVKPKLLVSGSAIGWYGVQGKEPLDEHSGFVDDFTHQLCERWEKEAAGATAFGVQVALLRTGIVIHPEGGMLARLITPFKLGAGGKLGDGEQIMSWISRQDWVRATWFIIQHHLNLATDSQVANSKATDFKATDSKSNNKAAHSSSVGQPVIYNLTAPQPVTNLEFTNTVGDWLHRPTVMTLPDWFLKLSFGEMSTLLIDGQKVLPQALLQTGFEFEHPQLKLALKAYTSSEK